MKWWNRKLKDKYMWSLVFIAWFGVFMGYGMGAVDRLQWGSVGLIILGFLCFLLFAWKAPPEIFEER